MITQARLKQLLAYDPMTGVFTWLVKTCHTVKVNGAAGSTHRSGYIHIGIDGRQYHAHRVAWLYVYGVWPTHQIDHINGMRADNRIANLRDVTRSVNKQNLRRAMVNSNTGFLGVSRKGNRFRANITIESRLIFLGYFETPELAHDAYIAAKRLHHPGNTL